MNGLRDNLGNSGPTGPAKLAGYNTAFTVVEDTPDQQSTDASGSSSDALCDPPVGFGCQSDDTGSASTPPSSSSDSGGSDNTAAVSSDTDSSAASCDPAFDFGCRDGSAGSSDDTGNTSGTVSSLGVTLEEPAVGLVHMGVGNLRGWAVSSAGIRKVEAFLDGEFLGEIPYGGARTDVGLAFPDIDGSDQSGFGMSFNYSGLSAGIHTIEVVAHSIDNKTASDSAQFETVRFDSEFIGAGEVINLNAAASVLTNDQIRVENISIAGEYYNLLLRWRTAEQGFEIVEIEALD